MSKKESSPDSKKNIKSSVSKEKKNKESTKKTMPHLCLIK